MDFIRLDSLTEDIAIRRSRKARRQRIVVRNGGQVEVVVSPKASSEQIKIFLTQHQDWILRTLQKVQKRTRIRVWPEHFNEGAEFFFRGQKIPVIWIKESQSEPTVELNPEQGGRLYIRAPAHSSYRGLKQAIIAWLKPQFEFELRRMLSEHTPKIAPKPKAFRIRPYKSIWGSCTRQRVIRLNFYLNFVPLEVMEYVVVHELCHLVHMNHSQAFWKLVHDILPDFKDRQTTLKNLSSILEEI